MAPVNSKTIIPLHVCIADFKQFAELERYELGEVANNKRYWRVSSGSGWDVRRPTISVAEYVKVNYGINIMGVQQVDVLEVAIDTGSVAAVQGVCSSRARLSLDSGVGVTEEDENDSVFGGEETPLESMER